MQWSVTVGARAVFLSRIHEIRQSGWACIYYLEEMWVNQNHNRKRCWKVDDCSGSLRVCHAESVAMGFIPDRKVFCCSKLKTLTVHHNEVTLEAFKE
jgi:hypothetical protein